MANNVEHSLQSQNVSLHLEIKQNLPIGDDIIRCTKPNYSTTWVKRALWLVNLAPTICPWVYAADDV